MSSRRLSSFIAQRKLSPKPLAASIKNCFQHTASMDQKIFWGLEPQHLTKHYLWMDPFSTADLMRFAQACLHVLRTRRSTQLQSLTGFSQRRSTPLVSLTGFSQRSAPRSQVSHGDDPPSHGNLTGFSQVSYGILTGFLQLQALEFPRGLKNLLRTYLHLLGALNNLLRGRREFPGSPRNLPKGFLG